MKLKRPSQDIGSLKTYQGEKEKVHFSGFFHRDYWRGRRDGKGAAAEGITKSVLSSIWMDVLFASVLTICEMFALASFTKSTFGQGLVPALVIAFMLNFLVALGFNFLVDWFFSPERNNQLKWSILVLGLILTGVWLGGDGCPVIFDPKVARGVQVAWNIEIIESLGYEDGSAVYLIRFNDELKKEAVPPQEGECLPLIGQF